ncbi:MAG TPA: LuxR C-terminal-related transcriptional regulator [Gaiellaceae bacterium]
MTHLASKDAARILRFVAEAYALVGDEGCSEELLLELGTLVEADWVGYSDLDWVRRRLTFAVDRPGNQNGWPPIADTQEFFWDSIADAHPIRRAALSGRIGAMRFSDFGSRAVLRRTRLYNEWMRLHGTEHTVDIAIRSPEGRLRTFHFDRSGGRDFTDRERDLLDALEPHLRHLARVARTRRLLNQALEELDSRPPEAARGVVLLGQTGEVEFASAPAARLLGRYFPASTPQRLPDAVAEWLDSGDEPLIRSRGRRRLTISRCADRLLLEEHESRAELTPREREVLSLVAKGMTNAEIAQILWVARSTVRKHLENVYGKLGVSTRTAAVAQALGGGETS